MCRLIHMEKAPNLVSELALPYKGMAIKVRKDLGV